MNFCVELVTNWSKLAWALPNYLTNFALIVLDEFLNFLNAHIFEVDLITCQITSKQIDDFMIHFLITK
jgi:hypothetical protein